MNWALLKNSLWMSVLTALFSVAIGFFVALWLTGVNLHWRKVILLCAVISLALPPFLVTNCWLHFLGHAGVWRKWLPLDIFSLGGTVWILTLMMWPLGFFMTSAAWRRIEVSQIECDVLLKSSSLIRWLLIPMARTAMLQAAVITFVFALNNFAVPSILQVKVFTADVWVNFNTTFDYKTALQNSLLLIVIPLVVLFFLRGEIISWQWKGNTISPAIFRRRLGPIWFWSSGIISVAVILFSVALPLWQLIGFEKTWANFVPAFTAGKMAVFHSLLFSALVATCVIAISLCTWKLPLGKILWLPFLIPGVLLGITLIWIFNRPVLSVFYQSIGIVIVAYTIRYIALGWNGAANALRSVDRHLTDAGRLEGANGWQLFRHVHLRQVFPQLCAAWYVTYLLCLWDVEALVLIVPPGCETVALRVFNLLHYGYNSQVNALCLLLLVLAILPLAIWILGGNLIGRIHSKQIFKNSSSLLLQLIMLLPLLSVVSGCSDSSAKNEENNFPIQSRFFSHVQIIGSRGTGLGQFNKPRSLALDANDNLFVVDMTGRVQKFSSNGVFLTSWQMPQTELGKPKGMCRDIAGNIIVIEPHYSRVNHFSPDGKLMAQWGIHGTNVGQLETPRAVGINSRGDICVSEYGVTERVQVFSKDGHTLLKSFGTHGSQQGEFNRPEGLGLDGNDKIYVADSCNHRIQMFSPTGDFLSAFGKAGSGPGELSYPYDIRINRAGERFVCEFGNSRIQIFNANNQSIEILGKAGGAPGEFSNPWSIALDSQENLYVADSQNHRVQKFIRRVASASRGFVLKNEIIMAENSHPRDADATR